MTSTQKKQLQPEEDLPEFVTLRSGSKLSPRSDYWRLLDGVRALYVDFDRLPQEVSALKGSLKSVLIDILERQSIGYASNMYYVFRTLAEVLAEQGSPVDCIETRHLLNFIAKYGKDDKLGLEAQVSALLNRWAALGLPGVSTAAVKFLNSRRKKGNVKGEAVITLDPVNGPLTDMEIQDLMSAVNRAYAQGVIEEKLFLLTWLIATTGQRVSQYCSLKVKDVLRAETEHGVDFEINIPTAKRRDELLRESFLKRPLPRQLGGPLWNYAQRVAAEYSDVGKESPLFPTTSAADVAMQLNDQFRHHSSTTSLTDYFRRNLNPISPLSPRTGEPIHIAVGRFRDTLGTRAAQEGHGELIIAELLGHSDTQSVKCYVALIPEITSRLDKPLARHLASIANAFCGRVIARPEDASRAGEPGSNIVDYARSAKGVGSCGTRHECKFNAPLACYTCHNFEAWLDAPHEPLLEHLLTERERLLEVSGPRIASTNDRTIIAIQAVIETCKRMRQEEHQSDRSIGVNSNG